MKILRKIAVLFAVVICCGINQALAQGDISTVIANPGEHATQEIRINWHSPISAGQSYLLFKEKSAKSWQNATKISAKQEICTVFDSIYSKRANGENYHERVRFLRNTVSINGLKPGTAYEYKIYLIELSSNVLSENKQVYQFQTAPKSGKWSMGVISDMHVYSPLPKRQVAAMNMVKQLEKQNKQAFNMMLHVGDMAAWGGSYSFWKMLYADSIFQKYVWAGVNGNHDNMTRENGQNNQFFKNVNNNPENGYGSEMGVCYYFLYGDALFIMLNNEAMKSDEALVAAQDWVKKVITSNPARYVIVASHYQWFMGNDGKSSQYTRWKSFFDTYGVDLAISGNNHIYARTNALYADQETDGSKGTVYIQTPSSDDERGRELETQLYNQDLIKFRWSEGAKTVGAVLMKADKKQLKLTLYNRNGQALDSVLVKAKKK